MFSWDDTKNASNRRKHGIDFETACRVFDDPLHVSRQDRTENGELRWQTLGMVSGVILLLVAHTWRETPTGEAHIRIVSARRATRLERSIYEKST